MRFVGWYRRDSWWIAVSKCCVGSSILRGSLCAYKHRGWNRLGSLESKFKNRTVTLPRLLTTSKLPHTSSHTTIDQQHYPTFNLKYPPSSTSHQPQRNPSPRAASRSNRPRRRGSRGSLPSRRGRRGGVTQGWTNTLIRRAYEV